MKIEIKLKPFSVPNFVLAETRYKVDEQNLSFSIKDISENTLSDLCDQFRKDVFTKAMKRDPKTQK